MKEKTITFFKQNTPFALLIGCSLALAGYIAYRNNGAIFNNAFLNKSIVFLYIIGLFIQIRRYRENSLNGFITYGKALSTGIWISSIASLVYGIFSYTMYSLYPELISHYLDFTMNVLKEFYENQEFTESLSKMMSMLTTPFTLGFSEFFAKFINGIFYSLIIALFLKKNTQSIYD